MPRAYDTRPDLEGFDALTWRGFVKYMIPLAVLFGAEFVASRFGLDRWFHSLIQLVWVAFGLLFVWRGGKSLLSREPLPDEDAAPRYAAQSMRFVSSRTTAVNALLLGALLIATAAFRLIQILSE